MTETGHILTTGELETLTSLESDDWLNLTLDDGTELTVYITDAYHEEPEKPPNEHYHVPGSLSINLEIPNSEYHRLNDQRDEDLNTQSGSINLKQPHPGKWKLPAKLVIYDPDVEDGMVVRDGWTTLGTITDVSPGEKPEGDTDG